MKIISNWYSVVAVVLVLGLGSAVAQAEETQPAEPRIRITSFAPVAQGSRVAEVCGKVTGALGDLNPLQVVADPRTKGAGTYNTFVTQNGKFCLLIVTFLGRVEVSLLKSGTGSSSVAASFE